tara:strand:+ start:10544 stop:12079 length:1536 start_codon:yes stop_codon:yes gene_type:complete
LEWIVNLQDLRAAIRVKTGYPERGDTGTKRLNNVLNQALRKLWGEIPEVLLREEYRIILEPQIKLTNVNLIHTNFSPWTVNDNRVFAILSSSSPIESTDMSDKVLRGRWFEVYGSDNRWHQRRIQDVYQYTDQKEGIEYDLIVVDMPFSSQFAKANMDARIYTYEYPYDAALQSIRQVIKNPEESSVEIPVSRFGPEMSRHRLAAGWQDSGEPDIYQRGDFFQLKAPRYTPGVKRAERTSLWGYDGSTFKPSYGPGGTFSYKVCHVWGRWPKERSHLWRVREQQGLPFYISSVSPASAQVTTKTGDPAIIVTTPDVDWMNGYSQDEALSPHSYHHHGVEKWIFRARHENQALNSSVLHSDISADGQYYLWKIVEGYHTSVTDNGSHDPVDVDFPLKDFVGHQHIRFNRRPTNKDNVLLSCLRRPDTMKHDADACRIPPECYNALIELSCSFLLGDRDGNLKRKSMYYDAYLLELEKLKRDYSFSGHERPAFGDGLGTTLRVGVGSYPVKEA